MTVAIVFIFSQPNIARSDDDQMMVKLSDIALSPTNAVPQNTPAPAQKRVIAPKAKTQILAFVTGYNTDGSQTDASPCTAAGGNICGRKNTVACPPTLPLHSWVKIGGKKYECMDRTALKYKHRFDISCDKDFACPSKVTGWKTIELDA